MFDRGKQPEYEMDLENRFVAPEVTENDRDNELSLRPHTLEEYIGQEQVKENLSVFMKAARLRGEPLDHVLLYGPPGLGRTTLSQIIAAEMGVGETETLYLYAFAADCAQFAWLQIGDEQVAILKAE